MIKPGTATIKATGERFHYEVKQSWQALYYSFDDGQPGIGASRRLTKRRGIQVGCIWLVSGPRGGEGMSAILITVNSNSATIEDLPPLARKAAKSRVKSFACPECGEQDSIRHRIYSSWHECKKCRHRYQADCSKHRHGGSLS